MTTYQYSSLNEALKETRLLTLEPGDFSADLHVSIHKVALSPENPPIYEALSYVWGSKRRLRKIQVGSSKIAITQNLAIALPYLRYRDKARILWIDAICINQQDLRERSSQIKLMGDVYKSADRVIVWLGTQKDNSTQALKALSQLSLEIQVDYVDYRMSQASTISDPQWSDTSKALPYSDQELRNIDALLHRPWFSRLWVWQEIKLANHNAVVYCGSDSISWQSLRRAASCMSFKQRLGNLSFSSFRGLRSRINEITTMCDVENPRSFGELIRGASFCDCSEPKDRIYATMSLLHGADKKMKIEPDYAKTTEQVFEDLVLQHIENRNLLEMLTHCNLQSDGSAGTSTWVLKILRKCNLQCDRPAEMPTWVPNWGVANEATPVWNAGRASGLSVATVVHKGGGILNVAGVISATITVAQKLLLEGYQYETMADEIRRLAPTNFEDVRYVSGGSLLDALTSTLCIDSFYNRTRPPFAQFARFEQSREVVRAILRTKTPVPPYSSIADEILYLESVLLYAQGRSFIKTKEGYIGLAPKATKPGDQISVLLGCPMPLVLRPVATSASSQHQYKVVGECYVHGLQDGEAFLGPLPDDWQPIMLRDQGVRRAFWEKGSGKLQYDDPRLEDGEWDTTERELVRFNGGSISLKITPNFLRRRGINVQSLDLI